MEFKVFSEAVRKQYESMSTKGQLFRTDVSKDDMWERYLLSFPEGTNPIFRERTEHDCQCCRSFIRNAGNVVYINDDYELESIWDIDIGGYYGEVAKEMSGLMKRAPIRNLFKHSETTMGVASNKDNETDIVWNHFNATTYAKNYCAKGDMGSKMGDFQANFDTLRRAMLEIKLDAVDTVLELIAQDSLYRGAEHKVALNFLKKHIIAANKLGQPEFDRYCWKVSAKEGGASRVRNSVIGTLVVDLSDGVGLTEAVKSFESKVAPANYKRTTALVTPKMIANAQQKATELGIVDSLSRRYAVAEDLTINNVLFADSKVRPAMNAFEELAEKATEPVKNYDKVEEIGIDKFIADVLPKADSIELMFENKHQGNCMSLIAPQNADAKPIFKWGNNFSWAYNGDVTDSMKERVKAAGGSVTGVLRYSIQWNDDGKNNIDFDAHCTEPHGNLISYPKKREVQPSSGVLDTDIMSPGRKVAVENITWSNINKMKKGVYKFVVHNYSNRLSKGGFTAEIEFDGVIHSFTYDKNLRGNQHVTVAEISFSKADGIKVLKSLPSNQASREICGVATGKFQKVTMVMRSPNHWDDNQTGNLHHFFILDNFVNEETPRGFFNEFLIGDLTEHRKVFEVLGAQMKVEPSNNQLSGLGFSSTSRNEVLCKIQGAFSRVVKIKF